MKLREIAIVRVPLCFYSPLSHYTFHSEAFEDRHGDADGDIFFRDFIRTGEGEGIPDICHFLFTRAKFLENKIYTEKRQFFALNL